MSFFPGKDPAPATKYACEAIAHVVVPRTSRSRRRLFSCGARCRRRARAWSGPFIFFDHFGPAEFRAGNGLDVRAAIRISGSPPSPICSTARSWHRDSLGTAAPIKPAKSTG